MALTRQRPDTFPIGRLFEWASFTRWLHNGVYLTSRNYLRESGMKTYLTRCTAWTCQHLLLGQHLIKNKLRVRSLDTWNVLKIKFGDQRSNSDKQHRSISRRLLSSCLSLICVESGTRVPIYMRSPWDKTGKNNGVTQEIVRWDMPTVHYGILIHNHSSQQQCHSHPGVLPMWWWVLDLWKNIIWIFFCEKMA